MFVFLLVVRHPMAEANGNTPHADGAAVEETVAEPQLAAEPEEPARIPKGLYFVRVPRPEFDESTIKNLQEEVSKQITKLKAINGKTQIKRVSIVLPVSNSACCCC